MIAAPVLPQPFRLVALETTGSTNDEARRLAAAGAAPGTVVWAREQSAGRGRRGRRWISPPGNLHVSFLIEPGRPPAEAPHLAFVAALAAVAALEEVAPDLSFACKWPNDVLCGGRKIAGMLIEPADTGGLLVLGIGIDVEHAPEEVLYPAVSLRGAGAAASVADVLAALCRHLGPWLERWRAEGFAPVRAAWLGRAAGLGHPVTVRLDGETLTGTFAGLDETGALLLQLPHGGTRRILAGDVFLPGA